MTLSRQPQMKVADFSPIGDREKMAAAAEFAQD
jgi:hypothetical protein